MTRTFTFYNNYTAGTKLNIAGYTFKSQIRERLDLASSKLADFNVTANPVDSTVILTLNEIDTASLPTGTCWWDLAVTVSGNTQTWLRGQVIIKGGATLIGGTAPGTVTIDGTTVTIDGQDVKIKE